MSNIHIKNNINSQSNELIRNEELKKKLEFIYSIYNKKEFIHPDPLEFLEKYPDTDDREIAALIASSLAYGRVSHILKHVSIVFEIMKNSINRHNLSRFDYDSNNDILPNDFHADYLIESSEKKIFEDFQDFKYRFTNGSHIAYFLIGIKYIIKAYGSLKNCFISSIMEKDETVIPALSKFVSKITEKGNCGNLAPNPAKGSACKRNNLFLRWMIRKDNVDPGGWDEIPSSMLVVPLDTHMHHAGRMLGFTKRNQADMKTAIEITQGFRLINPDDPVKYDFCLTRFGIHPDMNFKELEAVIENKFSKE